MAGAVIRANRAEVNDRFPMLGFTVRTGTRPYFEAVVTTDPGLLDPTLRDQRGPGSFWSSRGLGPLPAERGEAVFILPDAVLRRFAGAERLYYAIATFGDRTRANPDVTRIAPEAAPFVTLSSGYTGRRLRQLVGGRGESVRWNGAGTRYAENDEASLEWAGDAITPGVEEAVTGNGAATNGGGPPGETAAPPRYDDGFGESLWHETAARSMRGRSLARARGLSDSAFDIGWADVPVVPEGLTVPGWLAAAAMLLGWRDRGPVDPMQLLQRIGGAIGSIRPDGLKAADLAAIAQALGLVPEPPATVAVDSLRRLVTTLGPQWLGVVGLAPRFVVVTGLYGDGTPGGTYVRINDPCSEALASSSTPAGSAMGSTYVLTFQQILDAFAAIAPGAGLQAIHVTEADMKGRVPLVTSQAYAAAQGGTALRSAAHSRTSRAQAVPAVVPIVSAIVGATMTRILNNEGDISWELDQLKGLKHPGDDAARSGSGNFRTIVTPVSGWPKIENALTDQIYADFEIEWQGNGHSVGNVAIKNTHTNDAVGAGLEVKATINDDATVYEGDQAALRVSFNYRFTRPIGSDAIAIRDFTLYADGTFHENSRWTQAPDGWFSTEQGLARAQSGALIKEAISPIVETALKIMVDSAASDLTYEVPFKLEGMKHVNDDKANRGPGPVRDISFEHKLPWWTTGFDDEISLTFHIAFQCDGRSVGNIVVRRSGANDAVGWALHVKGELLNDAGAYTDGKGGPAFAAIKLAFQSTYTGGIGPLDLRTKIALTDIVLYGNGDYTWKDTWTQ